MLEALSKVQFDTLLASGISMLFSVGLFLIFASRCMGSVNFYYKSKRPDPQMSTNAWLRTSPLPRL